MSASVKAEIDYSKLEDLRKRLPDLSDLDISAPSMDEVGKRAGETVDRLLGRQRRRTPWPQIVAVIGLIAVVGVVMAWLTWSRRSPWGGQEPPYAGMGLGTGTDTGATDAPNLDLETPSGTDMGWSADRPGGGLTAAEASLTTTGEADDRA